MIRNALYIFIVLIGLGIAAQLHVFHGSNLMRVIKQDTAFASLSQGIQVLNQKLTRLGLATDTVSVPNETEIPDETHPIDQNPKIDHTAVTSDNVLYYTNLERTKRGLKPLRFSSKLTRSANAKAADMFAYQYFAHESPSDPKKIFGYFIDEQHYNFARVSENLAMGDFATAKDVVTAWMDSPSHRANILLPTYRDVGASVQKGSIHGSQVLLIIEHFGTPKNSCPLVSQEVYEHLKTIENDADAAKKIATDLETKINQSTQISSSELDELIGLYNAAIRSYNSLVAQFKTLSADYNTQTQKYNECIQSLN
jgi:uncharacterized protein YkwD